MDASALVDLGERHYPEHIIIFRPIWDFLYEGIKAGEVISVDYVKIELNRVAADWRGEFLKKSEGMFLISEEIEMYYAGIILDIEKGNQFLENKSRDKFVSGADPWLIALARSIGQDVSVVSAEKKPLKDYGLGAVCKELKVRHINLVDFFEENNIGR